MKADEHQIRDHHSMRSEVKGMIVLDMLANFICFEW